MNAIEQNGSARCERLIEIECEMLKNNRQNNECESEWGQY